MQLQRAAHLGGLPLIHCSVRVLELNFILAFMFCKSQTWAQDMCIHCFWVFHALQLLWASESTGPMMWQRSVKISTRQTCYASNWIHAVLSPFRSKAPSRKAKHWGTLSYHFLLILFFCISQLLMLKRTAQKKKKTGQSIHLFVFSLFLPNNKLEVG